MNINRNVTTQELDEMQRFQVLVNSVSDYAIYMLNPQGYVSSWNSGAERFKGYTADEIIGQHFSMFYETEDRAAGVPERALKTALEEGKFEAEGWRVRKDGSRFWASVVIDPIRDNNGGLLGFAKVTRDITERRAAQDALRKSEEQFRLLVQGVTDYAIYMLSPNGEITNWNAGAERIKGYSAHDVIGTHYSRFYTQEDQNAGIPYQVLKKALAENRYEQEGWRVRKDGTRFWAHVIIDVIRNDQGELVGFAKITRDVTEKKQVAEELARVNAALFQSQKLEAIGQLTGGIAHDFNNLLAVMSNSLDVLMPRLRNEPEIKLLESMQRAVSRGATLTQQLLSFARQQPLKVEPNNVNALIIGFESVLRRAGHSTINFVFKLDPLLQTILIDTARFETALLNLIVNGRDAMPGGGTIEVTTENVALGANEIGTLKAASYVKISVNDNGHGMPADVVSRAFEPFFTTKSLGKGSGLGLSQVYGFIAQSEGEVIIESTINKGTSITIYLPALENVHLDNNEVHKDAPSTETVLIVEDDTDLMEVASTLFQSFGYEILSANNGQEAMEILERTQHVDVLFSDVMMPVMNGIELARMAHERWPDMHIVLASGYPLPALKSAHGNIDDFAFISKPYRLSELARKLRA